MDYQCKECTVCINQTCVPFDIGEDCIPPNNDIANDLKLYYEFFYLQAVQVNGFRCLPYGVSVNFVRGMPMNTNMTKEEFTRRYNSLVTSECDNWAFIPIENL